MKFRELSGYSTFRKIGRWWHKGEEIDVLEIDRKRAGHILADLKRKAALVKWHNDERRKLYGIIGK